MIFLPCGLDVPLPSQPSSLKLLMRKKTVLVYLGLVVNATKTVDQFLKITTSQFCAQFYDCMFGSLLRRHNLS